MISIQLSQHDGMKLAELLERAAELPLSRLLEPHLDSAQEKLGDGNAVAIWLRENVTLEMNLAEAEALSDFLRFGKEFFHDYSLDTLRYRLDQELAKSDVESIGCTSGQH